MHVVTFKVTSFLYYLLYVIFTLHKYVRKKIHKYPVAIFIIY